MSNSANFPAVVKGTIYPSIPSPQYPEQQYAAFNPRSRPLGVAFSGGGARAMSSAMGQMRGLQLSSLYNRVGAISCISGGSWFGTTFSFASTAIDDQALLGTQTPPSQLTIAGLQELSRQNICYPLQLMDDITVGGVLAYLYEIVDVPWDHLWARLLNEYLLTPLRISSSSTFFTLNADTMKVLLAQNPSLTSSNFYTLRPDRPYYIAGSTQVYPDGVNARMRQMEYTAMYSGTPQYGGPIGPNGEHYGYGYADNILFNTVNPALSGSNTVTARLPSNPYNGNPIPFLLCDQMGSSSSAPGASLDYFINNPDWFPQFHYWSPAYAGKEASQNYSFVDGGDLENTGIVALLRRRFPVILAFVNTSLPIGGTDESYYVDGIDAQISRLFGRYPRLQPPFQPPIPAIQVLNDNGKFNALAEAFHTATRNKTPLIHSDIYTIKAGNYFGVDPYPGNGGVQIIWFYNSMNWDWYNQLSPAIKQLLTSTDPANYMANFPYYSTVGQNSLVVDGIDVPQVLLYTPQQVNLLANMQCHITSSAATEELVNTAINSIEAEPAAV